MKGQHRIDLGQWPPACYLFTEKRAFNHYHRQQTGTEPPLPFPPKDGGCCLHMENPSGEAILMIAIGKSSSRDELAITLAHEATHAMRWILEHAGEDSPGTETEAYLVEHIVRQGLAALA